jgi:hypothetical protein
MPNHDNREIHNPKSRPAEPEPNRLAGTKPCRLCGNPEISPSQLRKRNYVCAPCHAATEKARYRRTSSGKSSPRYSTKVTTRIIDAVTSYGLPLTTNQLSELTGIPKRTCAIRVCELVQLGIFRHTGRRVCLGKGGPSFIFELVPVPRTWDGNICGRCPTPARCRLWNKCLAGASYLMRTAA